jgi:myo-inositol 2-dehydrogenase/D-chiro-inositol 1-dehydrogenase
MISKLRVGMVGTGRIGRVHLQTITRLVPTAELYAVTDANQASAQEAAALNGVQHVVPTFDDLLADKTIRAVLICSSTDTHSEYITKAARAGKHIFCEKPIDADLPRIDAALKAVEDSKVQLMIGFNRRFDPNHQRLKEAITAGEIGTPHQLHIISRDPAPPPIEYIKVSGGMFFDMTIHDFDMARFLFGEVSEVYAAANVLVDPAIRAADDVDTATITLKFANGAVGVIENSRRAVYGYDQRVEVFGSKGAARSDNFYQNAVTVSNDANIYRDRPMNFFMDRYIESYRAEVVAFIRAINEGQPSPVNGADGRAPVVIALAAMKSLRENRPVRLE